MSPEDKDAGVRDAVKSFFADPKVAARVVNLVTNKKPDGWSHRSCATYFNETYANEIKESIDHMIETGQDIVFRFETWCNPKTGYSVKTLYSRINQSVRFLVEHLDIDGKYSKWFKAKKVHNTGDSWTISFDKTLSAYAQASLKPEFALPKAEMPRWRSDLEDWLESGKSGSFSRTGIQLSRDDVRSIQEHLSKITGIMKEVTFSSIKVVRVKD